MDFNLGHLSLSTIAKSLAQSFIHKEKTRKDKKTKFSCAKFSCADEEKDKYSWPFILWTEIFSNLCKCDKDQYEVF